MAAAELKKARLNFIIFLPTTIFPRPIPAGAARWRQYSQQGLARACDRRVSVAQPGF
jgi:hypothetical protein